VQERVAVLTAQLALEKQRAVELLAQQKAQEATIQQLQQETENDVARLARHTRESLGEDIATNAADHAAAAETALRAEGRTIQEIKEWLIDNGYEEECWALANRKTPRVKKADWVNLMSSKQ
jgi:hypothetical protein